MFRDIRYYRLESPWPDSDEALSGKLEDAAFEPCGPLTERSSGWVPVAPDAGDSMARRVNGADLVRLRSQSRVLPPAVVNEELEARIEDYSRRMGEAPRPREKRRLKAETRDELLPKAMRKSDRIWGYVDPSEKVVGIDTATESVAERFLRRLRAPFGDLQLRPLQFRQPVSELLTGIFLGGAPGQFALGRECRMQDAADPRAVVRWNDFDLTDRSIRDHVAHGMHLTQLGIEYDNMLSFVLDDNGVMRKLRLVGMHEDKEIDNDPVARLDAEFALLSGTLRRLLGDLRKLLGGYA
ncbi:MAG: recombination-associated protein RdgC [Woeseiaceae bacterium]|nr:recombination-associated protein RdgC [Woeseiaceae bacterium]